VSCEVTLTGVAVKGRFHREMEQRERPLLYWGRFNLEIEQP
jgi:hypothetical protein